MAKLFNVLMVDDDQDDHQFFREALRGIKVAQQPAHEVVNLVSTYDGVQGMNYLLRRGSFSNIKDEVPDLIVLDLNMPVMDGFSVLEELRKDNDLKTIPVYVLTTSKDDGHKRKCKELGCAGFFSKPPVLEELRVVINKILNAIPED